MAVSKSKILVYDIETAPIQAYTWGIYEQNVALNQIIEDWHLLSFAAKWLDSPKIIYRDQRNERDVRNDKKLLEHLWLLLDECDIVLTQNGKAFDQKKVYARFIFHGMKPPSPFKHIDTKQIAKKNFGFTSNSLAHLCQKLGVTQKSEHREFPGMELWKECLAGNPKAWRAMEKYNKQDILALEAVYNKLKVWDSPVNVNLAGEGCRSCGGQKLQARGFEFTQAGKQQRYQCQDCGAWSKSSSNILSKAEQKNIKRRI